MTKKNGEMGGYEGSEVVGGETGLGWVGSGGRRDRVGWVGRVDGRGGRRRDRVGWLGGKWVGRSGKRWKDGQRAGRVGRMFGRGYVRGGKGVGRGTG